jgi:hypothetical protein
MVIAEDVTFFAGFLTGRANVGGVALAEAKSTAAVTNEAAVNLANQVQSLSGANGLGLPELYRQPLVRCLLRRAGRGR